MLMTNKASYCIQVRPIVKGIGVKTCALYFLSISDIDHNLICLRFLKQVFFLHVLEIKTKNLFVDLNGGQYFRSEVTTNLFVDVVTTLDKFTFQR